MKRLLVALVALALVVAPLGAFAQDNIYATAIIDDGLIYYTGSLDGTVQGVFAMNPDGSSVRKLYDTEALLLAASDELLVIQDYNETKAVFLKPDGTQIAELPGNYDTAVLEDGVCYLNNARVSFDGGQMNAETVFELNADEEWLIRPIAFEDGYLFYSDSRTYGAVSMMEDGGSVASLCRYDPATGEIKTISGEGTSFLDIDDGRVFYSRDAFWIMDGDTDAKEMPVDGGLFSANLDGSDEQRLTPAADLTEFESIRYAFVEDGVVYGDYCVFPEDAEGEPTSVLKRVTADGRALPDVSIPYGVLCGAKDGKVYLCTYSFDAEGDEGVQADRIVILDIETGEQVSLNQDNRLKLFYSEGDPELSVTDGRIYGFSYNYERSALEFFSLRDDGTDLKILAPGYTWAES